MLIKRRKAKRSKRGIYCQDRELKDTLFQPGTTYSYHIKSDEKKVVIIPSDKGNKVSRRKVKDGIKPVIDIRNSEALAVFSDCKELQVSIFEDRIVIEVFQECDTISVEVHPKSLPNNATTIKQSDFNWEFQYHDRTYTLLKESDIQYHFEKIAPILEFTSLFSGAGVMDQGFIEAGFTPRYALELNKDAAETYRYNHGDHIITSDITKVNKEDIFPASLVIGGPPCQGFSNSNRMTNFLSNPNNLLLKEYIEAIKANPNCKVFVIENVPQLLSAGNGQFKREIYESLSDFEITSGVLNAADFGTAQARKRAVFIGSKIGKIDLPTPNVDTHKTVREAFLGLQPDIPNQKDFSKPNAMTVERMKYVPEGGNIFDIPPHVRPKGSHSNAYKRLKWDLPSITIANPRKSMITHPSENRIISVRECARLFDLPDSFIFKGTLSAKQQQIANAVPVNLAKAVALKIKEAFGNYFGQYRFA